MHNTKEMKIDVVLIKGAEKNKGKWKIEKVGKLFKGKDDAICSVNMRTQKSLTEQQIHYLHPQ